MKIKTVPTPIVRGKTAPLFAALPPVPGGANPDRRALRQPALLVSKAALDIARLVAGLGVDDTVAADLPGEKTLLLQVDPRVSTLARVMVVVLPAAPEVLLKRAGVTPVAFEEKLNKLGPMFGVLGAAVEVGADTEDSRAVVGALLRKQRDFIKSRIEAYLPAPGLPFTDKQKRLQAIWKPVLEMEQKQKAVGIAKTDTGKKRGKRRAAEVLSAGKQEELLQTIVDAHAGEAIDPLRAKSALSTLDEQKQREYENVAQVLAPQDRRKGGGR